MDTANVVIKEHANLRRNWGWLLGLGILFVILGTIGLGMVVGLTLVSMLFLGVLLITAGIAQLIDVFQCRHWRGALLHAGVGVLYLMGGGLIVYDPILASTIITAMLASILIVIGVTRLIMAVILRHSQGWGWLLLAGIIATTLGALILLQWPYSGLWIIGLFIAIEMLVSGWTYIFLAFAVRQKS